MNMDNNNKGEDQWLNAIAGRSDPKVDPSLNREAEILRKALLRRKEAIDLKIKPLHPSAYQDVLKLIEDDEAAAEQQYTGKKDKSKKSLWSAVGQLTEWLYASLSERMQPRVMGGVAASFVLVIAVLVGGDLFVDDSQREYADSMIRNFESGVTQAVHNPSERTVELLEGLKGRGLTDKVRAVSNPNIDITGLKSKFRGSPSTGMRAEGGNDDKKHSAIRLEISNTSAVLEYLREEGFSPSTDGETITIILEKLNAQPEAQ